MYILSVSYLSQSHRTISHDIHSFFSINVSKKDLHSFHILITILITMKPKENVVFVLQPSCDLASTKKDLSF